MTGSGAAVIFMDFGFTIVRLRVNRELDLVRGIWRLRWSRLTIVENAGRRFASIILRTRRLRTTQGRAPANARRRDPAYSRFFLGGMGGRRGQRWSNLACNQTKMMAKVVGAGLIAGELGGVVVVVGGRQRWANDRGRMNGDGEGQETGEKGCDATGTSAAHIIINISRSKGWFILVQRTPRIHLGSVKLGKHKYWRWVEAPYLRSNILLHLYPAANLQIHLHQPFPRAGVRVMGIAS